MEMGKRMVKKLGGLVAGLAVAVVTIMLMEALGHRLFPPPGGPDVYATAAGASPPATLAMVVLAWFLGTLAGSWLAVRISRAHWTGWAIAGAILLAAVYTFTTVSHPAWAMIAGILAPLVGAWLGIRLASGSTRPAALNE
jgi:hypothetical protein